MARLRNSLTGVVVNVSDETAAALEGGSHTASGVGTWRSADESKPEQKKAPAKKKAAEKPSDD